MNYNNPSENENEFNKWKVHISEPLSSKKIIELMDNYPSLKKITCPPSLYNRISRKYIDVLKQLEIDIEVKYTYNPKRKYSQEEIKEIIELSKNNTAKEISKIKEIPINKVYYIIRKYSENKFNDYKRKYSEETRENIKKMYYAGFKPKEISTKEKIPLRTVYYILNKK